MKKRLKKVLSTGLVVAIVAAISIGGTLAYLTDRDSEANVFTVGDVAIDLNEDFEQGAELIPGVTIEKEVTITNTGKNDAWVWMTYAIPAALDNEEANLNVVHVNTPGAYWYGYHTNPTYIASAGLTEAVDETDTWLVDKYVTENVEINGVVYNVYTHLYNGAIIPGETTNPGMTTVYLDAHVDIDPNGDWYHVENGVVEKLEWNSNTNGNPMIYVSAYAIQTEGFATVEEAYAAYQTQWGDKGAEYGNVVNATPATGAVRPAGYEIALEGETINGLTVIDNSDAETNLRALYREGGIQGDLTVLNSTLDGTYAMNPTVQNGYEADLVCENTTFMGWVSYSGFESATFTNCTFRLNSEGTYNYLRAYDPSVFTNCEFKGTTLDVDDNGTITLVDCTYNGVLIDSVDDLTLASDSVADAITIYVNGSLVVDSADELTAALDDGEDVLLANDIKAFPVDNTSPYGTYYGIKLAGNVLDGAGNTIDFDKGIMKNNKYDNYGIMTSGGTIKNLTMYGVFRGIMIMSPTEDVILDNVHVGGTDVGYALNTGEYAKVDGVDLIVTGSSFKGWSSYAGIASASFTDCSFGVGSYYGSWPYNSLIKPYVDTTFTNCKFADKYYLDLSGLSEGCTVTLNGCTVNEQTITANICGTECDGTETFCVELPSWATSLSDCISFK